MIRALLDRLYLTAGILAACFLAIIAVLVLSQIVARYFGILLPGALELAGYSMAASSFLGLAYALRVGGHIRVNLVLQLLSTPRRRYCDFWSVAAGAILTGFFAFYIAQMVLESYDFGDRTPGLLNIPLWIVQLPMVIGLILLFVALMDELVGLLRGKPPSFEGTGDVLLADAATGTPAAERERP